MKIGINTLVLVPNGVGGTEYLTRSFLNSIEKIDQKNEYIVFCNRENFGTFLFINPKWRKVRCPINANNRFARILFEQLILPWYTLWFRCELLHSFGYFGPIISFCRHVITVHDANWLDCPGDTSRLQNLILNFLIRSSVWKAKAILTDSMFSKKQLQKYFPKKSIFVISAAVDNSLKNFFKYQRGKPLVKGKYILSVSAFYPHKNIPYLIKMFRSVTKYSKVKLIIVGQNGADYDNVIALIKKTKKIFHFKKVSQSDLANLYTNASLFILPSTYEGFGIPVYEALQAGLPVLVGNNEMYSEKVCGRLKQLNFEIDSDRKSVIRCLRLAKKTISIPSYDYQARRLVNLYLSLFRKGSNLK